MPEMTPRKWDEQSKEEKLNWCNLFKTKFSEYISKYSTKYNVPKSLLTLIIANELVDWQNADGTAFDGMRGGGVGYAQIAIDTLLKEGISGYEHELSKTIRSNKYIPKFLIYRIIRGKIHRDLRTTEGSVKFAAKLLRKYIEYYDSKVITNSFGPGFAKTGLFFLKRRDILCQQENITELMLPDPIMQMFCAIWNSGKDILDAKEKINDTNYRNAFIHASNAEILIEYLQNLL